MKIILTNGMELYPIMAQGSKKIVQGIGRDTLTFVFSSNTSMDELNCVFIPANCEEITIIEGDNQYVHKGYTIASELKREPVEVAPATESNPAVYESRVFVSMSQRTYAETQMAAMQAAIDTLLNGEV